MELFEYSSKLKMCQHHVGGVATPLSRVPTTRSRRSALRCSCILCVRPIAQRVDVDTREHDRTLNPPVNNFKERYKLQARIPSKLKTRCRYQFDLKCLLFRHPHTIRFTPQRERDSTTRTQLLRNITLVGAKTHTWILTAPPLSLYTQ